MYHLPRFYRNDLTPQLELPTGPTNKLIICIYLSHHSVIGQYHRYWLPLVDFNEVFEIVLLVWPVQNL